MRVLIVEDEQHLSIGLKFNFEAEGYEVEVAADGPTALKLVEESPEPFSLVILDLMLPGMSGYETCRLLRENHKDLPVMVLSARTLSEDKTRAFDVGVDQYVTKPFELRELLSRARNLIQRHSQSQANAQAKEEVETYKFAEVEVDFKRHQITVGGKPQRLTTLQFKLLQLFVQKEGYVLQRQEILQKVWGYDHAPTTRTVDMAVMGLRKIIETDPTNPQHLLSVRGAGYRFIASPEDANASQ